MAKQPEKHQPKGPKQTSPETGRVRDPAPVPQNVIINPPIQGPPDRGYGDERGNPPGPKPAGDKRH